MTADPESAPLRATMQRRRPTSNPEAFIVPKEAAFMLGVSTDMLYKRLRGPNPPPFKRLGAKYLLPRVEFTAWAAQDELP